MNGLSDATISSANAGQVLLYDGTDSFDNKDICNGSFGITAKLTATLPMMFGGHIYTVNGVSGTSALPFLVITQTELMLTTHLFISLQDTPMFSIYNMIMVVIRLQLEQEEVILQEEQICHQVMVEITLYI